MHYRSSKYRSFNLSLAVLTLQTPFFFIIFEIQVFELYESNAEFNGKFLNRLIIFNLS